MFLRLCKKCKTASFVWTEKMHFIAKDDMERVPNLIYKMAQIPNKLHIIIVSKFQKDVDYTLITMISDERLIKTIWCEWKGYVYQHV